MNKLRFIILFCVLVPFAVSSQIVAVKTNIAYDALTIPNLGVEVSFNKHITLDLSGNYVPYDLSGEKSLKHWMVQPELRYWPVGRYNGHFIGAHGMYMDYVFKNVRLPFQMKSNRGYDGFMYGGGISYGYQLYLSPRWNLEFTAGFGYLRFEHDKYLLDGEEPEYEGLYRTSYWGPTKLGVSIIFLIR